MKIAPWVWQLQSDYPGANPNDGALPVDMMLVKAADGMWPQGTFDNHPAEVSSPAAAAHLEAVYQAQGINMVPWVVPHGVYPGSGPGPRTSDYAFEEGKLHGRYAAASKTATGNDRAVLVVDLEPSYYGGTGNPQFWRDDLGAAATQVLQYLNGARIGGASEVWLSSVWRSNPQALRDVSIGAWLTNPLVTEIHPQVYWTDFRKPWRDAFGELDAAQAALGRRLNAARVRPTLPGNATVNDLVAAVGECKRRGYLRPTIWRRGTVSADVWRRLAELDDYETTVLPTPPPVDYTDLRTALTRISAAATAAGAALDRIIEAGR